MLIMNQLVEVRWNGNIKKHYLSKGYAFTKNGDAFNVKVEDLTHGSKVEIKLECDFCFNPLERQYGRYLRQVNESETTQVKHYDACTKCYNDKAKLTPKVKLSESDEIKLIEMYVNQHTLLEIRKAYKVTESKIYEILKKHSINKKRIEWTQKDEDKLIEVYENETWETILLEMQPFLQSTLTQKAMQLGLSRKTPFTDEELSILHEHYCTLSYSELLELLPNRTEASIKTKANRLGLKKREYWEQEDIEKFKEIYSLYPNSELALIFEGRSESSLSSMAGILNVYKASEAFEHYRENVKQEISEQLLKFASELGRTPTQEEITENPNMAGMISYHRYFGSYSNACSELGLDPNTQIFGRSYILKSINGDTCLSSKEKIITDLLINNNISFKKEEMYKNILPYGATDKQIRCDWYIGDIIVEYFGMAEREDYKARMNEKISLCELYSAPLIQLYPRDIKNNFYGLIKKFEEVGLTINIPIAV